MNEVNMDLLCKALSTILSERSGAVVKVTPA